VVKFKGDKPPALKIGDVVVLIDQRYFRPTEVETQLGDRSKVKTKLARVPEITVQDMCCEKVMEDLLH
jgi:GDPmannose 4,6-dehydratase